MSDSGDDFPDLEIGSQIIRPYTNITRIDVDAEIAHNFARKELKRKINEQKSVFDDKTEDLPKIQELPVPTICSFPSKRQFFHPDRSLRTVNCESLTTENLNLCPSHLDKCTPENAEEFFAWVRSKFKNSDSDLQRQYLQYLWLLMSCHSDPSIVQNCFDLLIEHNSSWKLKFEEVVLVFYNWGASPNDFVSEHDLESIVSSLDPSPIIPLLNVEKVLQVISYQLLSNNLEGSQSCKKSVFVLLTLLVLDSDYFSCLYTVNDCLEQLVKSQNSSLVEDYCGSVLQVVSHHAEVAFLSECVLPECMRWCLCLAYCQQVFSLQQTFVADPDPRLLLNILLDNFDAFLRLQSWALYSLISIVDSGISRVVSYESDHEIKTGFLDWLNEYMERRIERRTNDIDVDATLIVQLVSRLQAEWESTWIPEPSVPINEGANADEV